MFGQTNRSIERLYHLESQNKKLSDSILKVQNQNYLIKIEIQKQSKKIENQTFLLNRIVNSYNKTEFNWVKDLIYPFPLSIISAIIFWLVFSVYPEKKRRNKIRPKIDLDMYFVLRKMFDIFDTAMTFNHYSPSFYQDKINGNNLSLDDIKLGLKNKCKNKTYFYYPEINSNLMIIGEELYENAKKIDSTIERIFNFSAYLSVDEILLLEKIRKKLQVYDLENFSQNAITEINGMQLKPVDPSLSYMAQNIFELYELYIELQKIIFNNKYVDREITINKVQHYFYSDQFQKCKQQIKKAKTKFPKDAGLLDFYLFKCHYSSGKTKKSLILLENIFKTKPNLISNRGALSDYLNNKKVIELLIKFYSESEVNELNSVIAKENLTAEQFKEQATSLSKFYDEKKKNN